MGLIYKACNKITGKVYIGQTQYSLEERINNPFMGHKKKAFEDLENTYFYSAIRKYGWENFEWSVIEILDNSELDQREKHWIEHYKSNNRLFGYNQTSGGHKHYHRSPENKKKMSEVTKKMFESEEFRENFRTKVKAAMARPEVHAKLIKNPERLDRIEYKKALCKALDRKKIILNGKHDYYFLVKVLKKYFIAKFGKNFMKKAYKEKIKLGLEPAPKCFLSKYNKTEAARKSSSVRMSKYNSQFWSNPIKVQERREKVSIQMKERWRLFHENKKENA